MNNLYQYYYLFLLKLFEYELFQTVEIRIESNQFELLIQFFKNRYANKKGDELEK